MIVIFLPWFLDVLALLIVVGEICLYTCPGVCGISRVFLIFLNTEFPPSSNPTLGAIPLFPRSYLFPAGFVLCFLCVHHGWVSASSGSADVLVYSFAGVAPKSLGLFEREPAN